MATLRETADDLLLIASKLAEQRADAKFPEIANKLAREMYDVINKDEDMSEFDRYKAPLSNVYKLGELEDNKYRYGNLGIKLAEETDRILPQILAVLKADHKEYLSFLGKDIYKDELGNLEELAKKYKSFDELDSELVRFHSNQKSGFESKISGEEMKTIQYFIQRIKTDIYSKGPDETEMHETITLTELVKLLRDALNSSSNTHGGKILPFLKKFMQSIQISEEKNK